MTFWVSSLRAAFAFGLGVAILAVPDKASPLIVNFMGFYWLVAGLLNLKDLRAGKIRRRLMGATASWVGVATGAGVLAFSVILGREQSTLILAMLGVVILLTGVIHLAGGFEQTDALALPVRPGLAIGVIEVILGAILLIAPAAREITGWIAGAWALVASMTLAAQAVDERGRRARKHAELPEVSGD